jgi:hypothetical protein
MLHKKKKGNKLYRESGKALLKERRERGNVSSFIGAALFSI